MKIGFLFGAGAECDYDMPSGGQFALDIFREDASKSKKEFREMRENIDKDTYYANNFLPDDFCRKNISSFGRSVFENIIKDTIEYNRKSIVLNINNVDDIVKNIVESIKQENNYVDRAIEELTGKKINNISMRQSIKFSQELSSGNKLFCSKYFSALLYVYKKVNFTTSSSKANLRKIIISVIQLQLGALSEQLVRKINDNPFEKKTMILIYLMI